jgi:UDP-N-acetylglucosamine 2-epimerase (non-hydrolysing)
MKKQVTVVVGTRPELIRLSVILKRLEEVFELRLIHTGQNFDPKLSGVFIEELGIREPDKFLNLNSESLGKFLGGLFAEIEKELDDFPPSAFVLLGDTNSAMSGIIAKRRGIPVYHLEAGNRSFDANVPEEINRKIVDHFSDFNLAYTVAARANLIAEGLHSRNSIVIGSPLYEVFKKFESKINLSAILESLKLKKDGFFLVSAHRQENIDDKDRLLQLCKSLNAVALKFGIPVICSLHPRTKSKIESNSFKFNSLIQFHEPFGFFDYNKLQLGSRVVLSDSGSVAEESAILGFKAVTIRNSMERPEAMETGSMILCGIDSKGILDAISLVESQTCAPISPSDYLIPNTTDRVVNFIASTIDQHSFWSGLRKSH